MAWITLTENDLLEALAGPELDACKAVALGTGQADPVPQALRDAIEYVRGRIAGSQYVWLGDKDQGEDLPAELRRAALAIARFYVCDRLPASLVNDERKKEFDEAERKLDQVVDGTLRVQLPVHYTTQQIGGPAIDKAGPHWPRQVARRSQTRGL